jgi:hypothetical protein
MTEIPTGFRADAKGRLIPLDQIKAIDIERSDLVERLILGAENLQKEMLSFKKLVFEDIAAFIQLSAEQHGVQIGGNKGNVTLFSFNGKYKVVRQSQESIRFDESLQAAKALIDQCISEWATGSNDNIRVLINDAFQVDKEGKISTGRVLSLRRLDIRDEKWLRAMDAISDSIIVTDSKNYVRFYERDEDGKYQAISLDFANV